MGVSKLADLERPKLGDDVHKHPLKPQMFAVDPQDNLPRNVSGIRMEDAVAPALSPETFVCMGDESVFVVRDRWGDIVIDIEPNKVRFAVSQGQYETPFGLLTDHQRELLKKAGIVENKPEWIVVTPKRPQCRHYKRVLTAFEGDSRIRQVERVCSAQRGEGGEYVTLRDTEVFACEHRLPRDFVSEERLRRFDEKRVAEGKKSEEEWSPQEAVTRSLKGRGEQQP